MKSPTSLASLAVLMIGAALAVAPFAVDARRATHHPTPALVDEAAAYIADAFESGDCVVIRPSWFIIAAARFRGKGPGTEAWPFDAVFVSEDLLPHRLQRCERIWRLSFFGLDSGPAPLLPEDIVAQETVEVASTLSARGVSIVRYTPRTVVPARVLSDDLAHLEVSRGPANGPLKRCAFRGDRHRCGSQPWLDVRLESRHVGHHEVHWPYLHPGPGEEVLEVTWQLGPSVERRWVLLQAGLSMEAVRRPQGSSVRLEVFVGGVRSEAVTLPPRRWTLWPWLIEVPADAAPQALTLRIQADDPEWRELLVDAWLVDKVSPSVLAWMRTQR